MPAPTISALPTPPSRSSSPSTFSADSDTFLAALPTFRTQANTQASYLDTLAAQVTTDTATASASATAATGAANYKGAYSAGTTYQIGESVSYGGAVYIANTVNLAVTPTNGANWYLVANGDVLLTATQTLTNKTITFTDNTLTGVASTSTAQTLTNKTLTGPVIDAAKSSVVTVSASAVDCSSGNYFIKTATGALAWTVTNVPATGAFSFLLELTNGGLGAQTWFTGTKWPNGSAPILATSGVDVLGFLTDDGGTTWRGVQLMKDSK